MTSGMNYKSKQILICLGIVGLLLLLFITIIPNRFVETWAQRRANALAASAPLVPMTDTLLVKPQSNGVDMSQWWQAAALIHWWFVDAVQFSCKDIAPMGNYFVCNTPPFTVKKPCLVYSFGIANDFSFDGKMGTRIGCEVHSFDPSMMRGDFQYSKEVTFHNMGLGDKDNDAMVARRDIYVKEQQLWKMRTLKSIMKELGHENRVIDVLKMDIEGHEWAVIKNMLDDGVMNKVKQFCLEWHLFNDFPARNTYFQQYALLERLKLNGIKVYKKSVRSHSFSPSYFNLQGDMYFVNTRFV